MHGGLIKNAVVALERILFDKIFNKPLAPPTDEEKELVAQLRSFCGKTRPSSDEGLSDSESVWSGVENDIREKIIDCDPREFLRWHSVVQTMFPLFMPYISEALHFLKGLPDWDSRWVGAIEESPVGRPIPYYNYTRSSGNLIFHAYVLAEFESRAKISVDSLDTIFEFGGGYGSMCRLARRLGFKGKYIIFDRPIISALQRFYLKSNGIAVQSNTEENGVICVSEMGHLKSALLKLSSTGRRMFIATWSLSETPVEFRKQILSLTSGFDSFLFAYQNKFEGADNATFFQKWLEGRPEFKSQMWKLRYFFRNTFLTANKC